MIGVRFTRSGPVHFCDPQRLELALGERVVVETPEGLREGQVVIASGQVLFSELRGPLDPVVQRLGPEE